ncbi:GroES-like protein [Daedaleopsis nitida]|nr:GroES-like protein [Daedaleopsis nitida]
MSTPKTQKALFIQEKQGVLVVGTRPVPTPGAGELLVKNAVVGLNPIDWKIHAFGFADSYPAIVGQDAAGTVAAVGEGVEGVGAGDRVLYQGYLENDKATFQEYALIDAGLVAKLPENITFEQGAGLPLAVTTAMIGLYHREGGPQLAPPWAESGEDKYAGTPIVILGGAGAVGSIAIQLAKLSGFAPIIATASPRNTALLESYGATHVLDRALSAPSLRAEVAKIAGGPVALVFDGVSTAESQQAGFALLAPGGKLLVLLPDAVMADKDALETAGRTVVQVHGVVQFPMNVEFGKVAYRELTPLLESGEIRALNVEVLPGGLSGIPGGLERLKKSQVSATKLVARLDDTA